MERYRKESPYTVGPPIQDPTRFVGRKDLVERFFANLCSEPPQHLWVRGIRRSGKSSFLRHVADPVVIKEQMKDHPNHPAIAYVDLLADVRRPTDFYRVVADALGRALPTTAIPDELANFRQFESFIASFGSPPRPVILLDELDSLANRPEFDSPFWLSLRSLGQGKVVWVTASCLDLKSFTRKPGDVASPFGNDFQPRPVLVGSLSDEDATALVVPAAESRGPHFSSEEVQGIRRLAGSLPYMLQATAEAWYFARMNGIAPEACRDSVISELLDPRTMLTDIFSSWWRHLTLREQQCLQSAADRRPVPQTHECKYAQDMLRDYGLLARSEGALQPSGELLRNWLVSERHKKGQPGVFIGHGHGPAWRAVRDFVERRLGWRAVCYEEEEDPKEGKSIVNILDDMLNQSEYAVIVLTAEETMAGGKMRARQNVVHEAGYSQGKLGFDKVVLLKQRDAENLSNLDGLQYIEFEDDAIQTVYPALFSFFLG